MAEASSSHQNLFTCSICSDLLKDAVTIPCGHNYCKGCVKGRWDQEDQTGVYSCPQCRLTFTSRPVLNKNNVLAALVEQFRKTRVSAASSTQCFAGPGDVECDSCTGRKLKAVKSCLVCLMSYCENHLQLHDELIIGKRHTVVDVTGHIQDKICSQHQRLLEVFCSTDQSCVCLLCLVDEHKGHDTVPAAAERAEKQKQMGETKKNFQERLNEREKKLQELRTDVETLKSSAQAAVKDSEGVFTEINRSIQRKHSEVTELIRAQEKAEVSRAKGLQMQLEQEIAELKRRDAELEQLSHTEDHIHFLKNFQSVSTLPKPKDESYFHISNSCSFEAVKKSVSTLKGQLDDVLKQKIRNTSAAVSDVPAVLAEPVTKDEFSKLSDVPAVLAEPVTKDEFSKYFSYFTLDPNTAHTCLHLSEGNRRVEWRDELQSYPDHPERFDRLGQVLCRECVSGRCYWEVEWSGKVSISVSYNTISRKGGVNECGFGANDQSWSLSSCFNLSPSFRHNNEETKLPLVASSRIGVYVDHRAGTLAFYSISDTMTLLHRVQTTFTQPLYPGFCVGSNLFFTSACSFCDQ